MSVPSQKNKRVGYLKGLQPHRPRDVGEVGGRFIRELLPLWICLL